MAREPFLPAGSVSHDAQESVDRLSREIIERGDRRTVERREIDARDEKRAERREANDAGYLEEVRERGRKMRARAHRTVTRDGEAAPGAPRSGSA